MALPSPPSSSSQFLGSGAESDLSPAPVHLPMLVIETTAHLRPKTAPANGAASKMASGVVLVEAPPGAASPAVTGFAPSACSLRVQEYETGLTRGGDLISAMDALLRAANRSPSQIASIGINIGPGSWTGLRIGLTAAKTLASAGGLPLVALDGLLASALLRLSTPPLDPASASAPTSGLRVAVVQDSGHGKLCIGVYRQTASGWPVQESAPAMIDIAAMRETFAAGPGILLGLEALPAKTREAWEMAYPVLPPGWVAEVRPRGLAETALACVTAAQFGRFIYSSDRIHRLAPLYLKDPYSA